MILIASFYFLIIGELIILFDHSLITHKNNFPMFINISNHHLIGQKLFKKY